MPKVSKKSITKLSPKDRLKAIQTAYNRFVAEWDSIQREEAALLKEVHGYIDREKLNEISAKIKKIKS